MKRFGVGVAVALLVAAGAARADMRARADAMIAEAGAADLFTNVTTDDKAAIVRHNATGMECRFASGVDGRLMVLTEALPRGDDVACDRPVGDISLTFYATRMPGVSAARELAMANAAIKMRWKSVRKYKPMGVLAKMAPQAKLPDVENATSWFAVKGEDGPLLTRVSTARVGDWIVKMRATAAAPDIAGRLELLTDALWIGTLDDLKKAEASADEAPG